MVLHRLTREQSPVPLSPHRSTPYQITVENAAGVSRGVVLLEVDGREVNAALGISLVDDGQVHAVRVVLGEVKEAAGNPD